MIVDEEESKFYVIYEGRNCADYQWTAYQEKHRRHLSHPRISGQPPPADQITRA